MSDFPGKEFAEQNGYSLYSFSGNRTSVTYTKRIGNICLHLTCRPDGTAELVRIIGLITCTTGSISYPHKNFVIFENALLALLEKPGDETGKHL